MNQDLSGVIAPPIGEALLNVPNSKEAPPNKKSKKHKQKRRRVEDDEEGNQSEAAVLEEISVRSHEKVGSDPVVRRKLIQKIQAWAKHFSQYLDEMMENKDLENMTQGQLEDLQKEIKQVVGTRNMGDLAEWAPLVGLTAVENTLLMFTPLRVEGLTGLSRDPSFKSTCKEIMLDFSDLSYIDPWYRVGFMVANTCYMLDSERRREDPANDSSPSNPGTTNPAENLTPAQKEFLAGMGAENVAKNA